MNLVIVESPTKARTIGKFLGKDYEIKPSMGHIIDLPKSKIGIDFEHGFAPLYEIVADKKQIIADLKSSAKKARRIILATDPDREGEAIAAHVAEQLTKDANSIRENSQKNSRAFAIQRIVFHEITKEAIDEALKSPRNIDKNLVDAQTARRVLDRLVGYKLSPLLWKKVRTGLSAGRVQSVALRLIVEREREIEKFGKEKYWTISAILGSPRPLNDSSKPIGNTQIVRENRSVSTAASQSDHDYEETVKSSFRGETRPSSSTEFNLIEINGGKIEVAKSFDLYDGQYKVTKTSIDSEEKAKKIAEDLKTKTFTVSDVLEKETKRSPAPPYTTSTLQQDAARRLFISGRKTMSLAQKLYEEGYITYHRTDSVAISSSAMFSIISFVKKEYGEKYVPRKPRFYKTRQKLAQEAHEAIRPTRTDGIQNSKFKIQNELGSAYWKLYDLIWKRAVASQMADAIIESTSVLVDSQVQSSKFKVQNEGNVYKLKANGSVLMFDGFLKVNPLGLSDTSLPKFTVSEKLNLIDVLEKEHETLPPPRYNDASIIKTLEEKGIGRPSTYATIISTIESRQYIESDRSTGSGRRFAPTVIGVAVNDFLVKNFSDIDDIPFTALMEDSLDAIAHGEKEWVRLMKDFYAPFEKKLTEVEGAQRVKIAVEQTNEKCPTCGFLLVIRTGRFGKFLSCSRFPKCKFTKTLVEKTGLTCPKDSGEIVIKKTRRGRRFYGCSNYPACTFAAWKLEDIKK